MHWLCLPHPQPLELLQLYLELWVQLEVGSGPTVVQIGHGAIPTNHNVKILTDCQKLFSGCRGSEGWKQNKITQLWLILREQFNQLTARAAEGTEWATGPFCHLSLTSERVQLYFSNKRKPNLCSPLIVIF